MSVPVAALGRVLILHPPRSGDGTLSVIDVRSKKTEPIAQSEDQEDELLSLVTIKGCVRHNIDRNSLTDNSTEDRR